MSSVLFSSISLGSLTLANRIVIPPMCQYSAEDGLARNWHVMHYGALSHSGAGMLIMEATAVTPEGRISPADLGLWDDRTEECLARLVAVIRQYSSIPLCLQLAHAGRKASQYAPWVKDGIVSAAKGGWQPEAPSALMYEHGPGPAGGVMPRAMEAEDCRRVKAAFADAARRAARAGFDALEMHAAHGYLLHEFLSPISNMRTDDYGGSLERRMRYPLEVFEAIRSAFPADKPVGVRISATDWAEGGWTLEESCRFSVELQRRGSAYVHVSGGGLSPQQKMRVGPGYQVEYAAVVREELRKAAKADDKPYAPVIAVGLITEPLQAESIVASGQADMTAVGRGMLYDPRWPWRAASKLGAQIDAPPQYWRSAPHGTANLFRK